MPPPRVSFFYDFTSPYTYLASTQIDAVAEKHGVKVSWEPALLGGVMKAVGNQPPALLVPRGEYMLQDLTRWSALYGVPFRFSPCFPLNSMAALRGALGVRMRAPASFAKYNHAMFRAAWVDGRDIGSKDVIEAIAKEAQLAPEIVLSANDAPNVKELLKEQTQRAVSTGAFGMPWVVVEQELADGGVSREGYFGNDRLPMLDARLSRGAPWPKSEMAKIDVGGLKA